MTKEYSHELKIEFHSISGKYVLEKKVSIEVEGKEVLLPIIFR